MQNPATFRAYAEECRRLAKTMPTHSEALFPQGFEITYFDAFGRRNQILSGGMFLQPSSAKPYSNLWIRWGGRVFGELNYLSWRSGGSFAKMYGVSVGFPLAKLL